MQKNSDFTAAITNIKVKTWMYSFILPCSQLITFLTNKQSFHVPFLGGVSCYHQGLVLRSDLESESHNIPDMTLSGYSIIICFHSMQGTLLVNDLCSHFFSDILATSLSYKFLLWMNHTSLCGRSLSPQPTTALSMRSPCFSGICNFDKLLDSPPKFSSS